MFEYYTNSNASDTQYYQFPAWLLTKSYASLSANAKIAYMLLRDRMTLSIRNGESWLDELGRYFIYFPQVELSERLDISLPSAKRIFQALKEFGLIEVSRRGMGQAARIYVLRPCKDVEYPAPYDVQEPDEDMLSAAYTLPATNDFDAESMDDLEESNSTRDRDDCEDALDAYNAVAQECQLELVPSLDSTQNALLRLRLNRYGLDGWQQALDKIRSSDFLCGRRGRGSWKVHLDWLIRDNANIAKILGGNYDQARDRPQSPGTNYVPKGNPSLPQPKLGIRLGP